MDNRIPPALPSSWARNGLSWVGKTFAGFALAAGMLASVHAQETWATGQPVVFPEVATATVERTLTATIENGIVTVSDGRPTITIQELSKYPKAQLDTFLQGFKRGPESRVIFAIAEFEAAELRLMMETERERNERLNASMCTHSADSLREVIKNWEALLVRKSEEGKGPETGRINSFFTGLIQSNLAAARACLEKPDGKLALKKSE